MSDLSNKSQSKWQMHYIILFMHKSFTVGQIQICSVSFVLQKITIVCLYNVRRDHHAVEFDSAIEFPMKIPL